MSSGIGEFLKKADVYTRLNRFDEAEQEVDKALEREPTNPYAIAYKERVRLLRSQFQEKLRREEEERQRQEEALRSVRDKLQYEEEKKGETVSQRDIKRYKEFLVEVWHDGFPNELRRKYIDKTRLALKISQDVHETIEKEAKIECYVNAVKRAIKEGIVTTTNMKALEEIRERFSITAEEHLTVELKILWELQGRRHTETLLLIDDEKDFVEVLRAILSGYGFKVLAVTDPNEALRLLKSMVPDLILCDVGFPNYNITGFSLYEEIRKIPTCTKIPIIFLTGMQDEESIRKGLQLGADDYVTKPFQNETLLALIEGKLRRYREIKKNL